MRTLLRTVVLAVLVSLAGGHASSVNAASLTLYDNLDTSLSAGSFGVTPGCGGDCFGNGPLANSFSTGAVGFLFSELSLDVNSVFTVGAGSMSVQLRADAGATPGGVLATLATISDSSLLHYPSTIGQLTLASFAPIALAPTTRYWIELEQLNPSTKAVWWVQGPDLVQIGVAGEFWSVSGFVSANNDTDDGPFQMRIRGDAAAAVPEPGTLALVGIGLACLVRFAHRNARPDRQSRRP